MDETQITPLADVGLQIAGDDVTHIIFILDRSGSMSGMEQDVIGGVNSFVKQQKDGDGAAGVSLVRFDNVIELVWNDIDVAKVPALTEADYVPRGNTALLDAMGMTIAAVKANPAHRYIVITHTDGAENASREWTAEKLKELIKDRESDGNWTFTFFGEGIDAFGQSAAYGYARSNTMSYDSRQRADVYGSTARVSALMRKKRMMSSQRFAEAASAATARPAMTDDDLEQILDQDDASATA
jgi:hypothetical protein